MNRYRRLRDQGTQRGQAIVMVAVALVVLMGCAALTIDLGYAWYAKRELQATVDAAALAGAQELPNARERRLPRANQYIALNPTHGISQHHEDASRLVQRRRPGLQPRERRAGRDEGQDEDELRRALRHVRRRTSAPRPRPASRAT